MRESLVIFLLLVCSKGNYGEPALDECIWYDTCGWNPHCVVVDGVPGCNEVQFLNCRADPNDPSPKPADEEALDLLQSECPHMYDELTAEGEVRLCCSTRQLRDLKTSFAKVSPFLAATCPTCWYNFRKNFCDLTCSPDQASFVKPNKFVSGPGFGDYEGQTVEMVETITVFAHKTFIEEMYDSCKDIVHPGIGPVMNFLCGHWGAENCDGFKMTDYQGEVTNGYSPFNIYYNYSSDLMTSDEEHFYHNPPVIPCQEPAPHQEKGCDCEQCSTCSRIRCPQHCHPLGTTTAPLTSASPGRGCSNNLMFSTSSFPDGKLTCSDAKGFDIVLKKEEERTEVGEKETKEEEEMEKNEEKELLSPGTTCIFLSNGHLGAGGIAAEMFCQDSHWEVSLVQL